MGFSPWGHKEAYVTEQLSAYTHTHTHTHTHTMCFHMTLGIQVTVSSSHENPLTTILYSRPIAFGQKCELLSKV